MKVILSIDQSTQGTKALVWDREGRLLARADAPHAQIISPKGWVSHDLNEIWANVCKTAHETLARAGVRAADVATIGLSNQRETACCWSRKTGEPLCHAIVWQCSRAAEIASELEMAGMVRRSREITGLPLSPFFSAPKFAWMLRNETAAQRAAAEHDICFGTIDSYLTWKMTHGEQFVTDCSNASRTGLMDLETLKWSGEMLEAYGLKAEMLPEIIMSDAQSGATTLEGLFPSPVGIHARMGDSHAALFAHGCIEPYAAKVTYGTGSSVMMNAGEKRPEASDEIVTSIAWGIGGKAIYCLEGNINYTGALITWLIEDMKLLEKPADSGTIAASLPDNGGVYLVPAFSGLGAPYFANGARAAIVGMSRSTGRAHIVRAAEEAICYQVADVVQAIERAAGCPPLALCADGGPTRDEFLMTFQVGLLDRPLTISGIEELSGAGAAYCAGVAAGVTDMETIELYRSVRVARPQMTPQERARNRRGWRKALEAVTQFIVTEEVE